MTALEDQPEGWKGRRCKDKCEVTDSLSRVRFEISNNRETLFNPQTRYSRRVSLIALIVHPSLHPQFAKELFTCHSGVKP